MLIRPSGGLTYHLRATFAGNRWRPFTDGVAKWLRSWNPVNDELILLGPSGGYTLPPAILQRFKKIHAFDLDPLAAFFFHRRHSPAEFHREDLFWLKGSLSVHALKTVLDKHPRAAILFSNLLGQLPLEGKINETDFKKYLVELSAVLKDREYATYHDLYSITGVPDSVHYLLLNELQRGTLITQSKYLAQSPFAVVTDHLLTEHEWPGQPTPALMAWSIGPGTLHIVEGVAFSQSR